MQMNNILLCLIVGIILFWLYDSINKNYPEKFIGNNGENYGENYGGNNDKNISNIGINIKETINSPPKIEINQNVNACPLDENDFQTKNYIAKNLLTVNPIRCPKPAQTNDEFNKDFFKFRDYTFQNSSMTLDSVDKIANMYLDGDLGQANTFTGMKIRDIYDKLTCGEDLYQRKCVRVPKLDNTMNDGYNFSFLTGMHNTRDEWTYDDDRVINGGKIVDGLYANDEDSFSEMPLV